jgi:GNAT superfamily N-acetyltransferase
MVFDQVWGRSGWVRTAGCAIGSDQDMELVRDLYAVLGEQWLGYGCFTHFAMIPVSDPVLVQMWFALSFGIEQVHALADLSALDLSDMKPPEGIEIRRAGPGDREALASLSGLIAQVQSRAPVWAARMPEIMAEQRGDWADLAEDPAWTVWLACENGKPVACQGFVGVEPQDDGLFMPALCVELAVAGTRERTRGRGIGRALTRRGMAHAHANGFRYCETDWRSANLFSSRFWPHRGFKPVVYRLVRRIDRRVAWARYREEP